MYKGVNPLPAQRNLASPPDLSPQQPVFSLDNYRYHRYSSPSLPDVSSSRTSREDIDVQYRLHRPPQQYVERRRGSICCALTLDSIIPCLQHSEGTKYYLSSPLIFYLIAARLLFYLVFFKYVYSFNRHEIDVSKMCQIQIFFLCFTCLLLFHCCELN